MAGSGSVCRGVYPEWGPLHSYSQTLLSIPSVVTILKSLSFLGFARQIRFCLSRRRLLTRLLQCGGAFCGWPPWKHNSRRWHSHRQTAKWKSPLESYSPWPCPCRWWKAGTPLFCVINLYLQMYTIYTSNLPAACNPEVRWSLFILDVPSHFYFIPRITSVSLRIVYGIVPF